MTAPSGSRLHHGLRRTGIVEDFDEVTRGQTQVLHVRWVHFNEGISLFAQVELRRYLAEGDRDAALLGLGPVPAVKQALDRAGWKIGDVGRIEINEAFAAIVLAVTKDLGLSPDVVNVEGGAIAHGHPIGAETATLAVYMGGGPAAVYGADALRAYDQFAGAKP